MSYQHLRTQGDLNVLLVAGQVEDYLRDYLDPPIPSYDGEGFQGEVDIISSLVEELEGLDPKDSFRYPVGTDLEPSPTDLSTVHCGNWAHSANAALWAANAILHVLAEESEGLRLSRGIKE